jgi:hypothetical protein
VEDARSAPEGVPLRGSTLDALHLRASVDRIIVRALHRDHALDLTQPVEDQGCIDVRATKRYRLRSPRSTEVIGAVLGEPAAKKVMGVWC